MRKEKKKNITANTHISGEILFKIDFTNGEKKRRVFQENFFIKLFKLFPEMYV